MSADALNWALLGLGVPRRDNGVVVDTAKLQRPDRKHQGLR